MPHVGVFQGPLRAAADIGLAHADHEGNHQGSDDQPPAMLRAARILLIDIQRMLIHAHETEQRIVELRNRAARPVTENLPDFQLLEVTAVAHGILQIPLAKSCSISASEYPISVRISRPCSPAMGGGAVISVGVSESSNGSFGT